MRQNLAQQAATALLITGPLGSGKSTLAAYIGKQPGWVAISEDDYWVKHGWVSGYRSPEQERVVQQEVFADVMAEEHKGTKVALEFILYYPTAPNPLTNYQDMLTGQQVLVRTVVLKPSLDEIMRRIMRRGRPHDINNQEAKRKDVEHELACIEANYIKPEWVFDPTNMSVDDLYRRATDSI